MFGDNLKCDRENQLSLNTATVSTRRLQLVASAIEAVATHPTNTVVPDDSDREAPSGSRTIRRDLVETIPDSPVSNPPSVHLLEKSSFRVPKPQRPPAPGR